VSSVTNFALGIYVVRTLGAVQFGAFGLAYVTYGFALSASRGLATDPLMVRFSGTDVQTWRRAVAKCTGTATCVGLAVGALVLTAAAVLSGPARAAFFALGLTLPGLLLQDSWRYSFFALGRGGQAFLNDSVWAVTLVPALVLLKRSGHAEVFWFVLAWGITGAIGAAVGPLQARVIPKLAGVWSWVSRHRDLGPRYLVEGISTTGATQLRTYAIGLILGLAAIGSVGAVSTLFGPVTIVFFGMSLVTIPEAARVLRRSPRHLPLFCLLVSGGLSAAAVIWGIALLVAVPRGFGSWLLGPIWRSTYPLIVPWMLFVIGQGIGLGVGTGLHALGAAKRSLRLAVFCAVLNVAGAIAGALKAGAVGTVWGIAVAAWIGAVFGWRQLSAAHREFGCASGRLPQGGTASGPSVLRGPARQFQRLRMHATAVKRLLATAALAVAAVTGWMLVHHVSGAQQTVGTQATATGRAPVVAPASAPVTARTLKPVSTVSFDPYGAQGASMKPVPLPVDTRPTTAWHTDWYTTAHFGNLKPGTGLLLDMGRTVTISGVRLLLGSAPGADFQLRVGAAASSLDDLPTVTNATDAGGRVDLQLTKPAHGRYLLIWFTNLSRDTSGAFQASIYGVSVEGWT
jgi:O-antigen/teichoic acid export membrane protein